MGAVDPRIVARLQAFERRVRPAVRAVRRLARQVELGRQLAATGQHSTAPLLRGAARAATDAFALCAAAHQEARHDGLGR